MQTDTQTDTKVNTEDTLSWFQDFFLQPIIMDQSNKAHTQCSTMSYQEKQPKKNFNIFSYLPLSCRSTLRATCVQYKFTFSHSERQKESVFVIYYAYRMCIHVK